MPALAVSTSLKAQGAEILYVGSHAVLDRRLVEEAGFEFRAISAGKLRRYFSWQTFIEPFRIFRGFWQSVRLIRLFKPDAVFGKGGFVSLPVIRAAKWLGVPVVLHESDSIPGLANRIGAKTAQTICVSFPVETMRGLPTEKLIFTGNPLNANIIKGKEAAARKRFKLTPGRPVVLVLGGSQGALAVNQLVLGALPKLLDELQVVHQVGERSAKEFIDLQRRMTAEERKNYRPIGFIDTDDLADLYAAADLIVSRAGANSLAEIAAVGKPSILIPLPAGQGAGDQDHNAAYFTEHAAATVLPQQHATSDELARMLKQLLHDPQRRTEMGRAARQLAVLGAADRIAEIVWKAGERG